MAEREDALNLILEKDVKSVDPKQIDALIEKMIQSSSENYEEIGNLALECSAALSSAQAKSSAMASRNIFKRGWDKLTGKDDKLRSSIEHDNVAAQYAMQQTIKGVLKECTLNRKLALVIKDKLEGELLRLEEDLVIPVAEDVNRTRQALVRFYSSYLEKTVELERELNRRDQHSSSRCEYCREPIEIDQVVCHCCGTLQKLKMEKLPMNTQKQMKRLSQILQQNAGDWDLESCWNETAKKYATRMMQAQKIANNAGLLVENYNLTKDIDHLVEQCRNAEFQIAIVGIVKSGKSTLMNALIGTELAATDVNPFTATLTKFSSTSQNSYIKVSFYKEDEWKKLNKSAAESRKATYNQDIQEIPLYKKLENPAVQTAAKAHFEQPPLLIKVKDIDDLKDKIKHWTTVASDDHLIAREVEVYVNEKLFSMPKEIVFVDTPGLCDPVKYRSEITEQYLDKADAVLIANSLAGAWALEVQDTIRRTFECVGSAKKDRIYIVGTQKDRCNDDSECRNKITGVGGWVDKLLACELYKTKEEARDHIVPVSSRIELLMRIALKTSPREYKTLFTKDDYSALRTCVERVTDGWDYSLLDFPGDEEAQKRLEVFCGINRFKKRLQSDLIQEWETLKIRDIALEYKRCKKEIQRIAHAATEKKKETISAAKGGKKEVEQRLKVSAQKNADISKETAEVEEALKNLKRVLDARFRMLSNSEGKEVL